MCVPGSEKDPKETVRCGYDLAADAYAQLENGIEWPRMKWLRKVLSRLEPNSAVLDLGCGSAMPAGPEIAKAHRLTGVDISEAQIERAQRNVSSGTFVRGDLGSVVFSPDAFDAVLSFYTLEHIPRVEHAAVLRRIHSWLRGGGLLLFSIEAGDYDDVTGEWLGVPMFLSCFDPETTRGLARNAGFEILETEVEVQIEAGKEIPYLWVLARRP